MGGTTAVYEMRTLVVSSENRRETDSGPFLVPTRTYYAFPLNVRQEVTVNGRLLAMTSSPAGGVAFTPDGPMPLDEITRVGIERTTMRNPVVLMKSRLGREFSARHAGRQTRDGREVDVVQAIQQENETTILIDRADERPVEIRYNVRARDASLRALVVRFDDWQSVGSGLNYPATTTGEEEDRTVFEIKTVKVDVNVPLDPSLFLADFGGMGGAMPFRR